MTGTAPRTVKEYSEDFRIDGNTDLAVEYAKVRLMEQIVAGLDDQNAHLETIADNMSVIAYNASDGDEYYTQ